MSITLGGSIDNDGKMLLFDRDSLAKWVLKHPNEIITFTIKLKMKKRTCKQNSYYWGVVVDMIMHALYHTGNFLTEQETHEFLKSKFNGVKVTLLNGNYVELPASTNELDTKEFQEYIGRIQQFAAEALGIYIPDPNEQIFI